MSIASLMDPALWPATRTRTECTIAQTVALQHAYADAAAGRALMQRAAFDDETAIPADMCEPAFNVYCEAFPLACERVGPKRRANGKRRAKGGKAPTKARKPRILETVRTTRYISGAFGGIPSGTSATVTATGSGRFQIEPVSCGGVRYWCDADAIEVAQ